MITNFTISPFGFTSCSFSVQTNHLNETSHSILLFHSVWFIHYYGKIPFVSSIVLNLFCLMPNFQPSNWFHEPIIFTKSNLEFSFGLSTHFKSFFCKFLVGVAGLEPTKESELQRLPPYQLGYTPRFRPLLNYHMLAFLGLASILTLSQWDSNPSLQQACRNLSQ